MNISDVEETPAPVTKPSSSAALRSVVVFWGTVALVQFAVFCLFRKYPGFKKIYNVRDSVEKLKCDLAARIDSGSKWNPVSWIPSVLNATEDEIFAQVGLDGLCYLRTIKVGMKLSLMGCFIALFSIPTYYTSPKEQTKVVQNHTVDVQQSHLVSESSLWTTSPRSNFNVTDPLDRMSMGATFMGDPRMAASVLSAYLISIYAMWLLRKEFNWYIIQRYRYLKRAAPQNYTLFVHHVPPNLRSKAALQEWFGAYFKDILEIHVVKKIPSLEKLCAQRDNLKDQIKHQEALLEKLRENRPNVLSAATASFRSNRDKRQAETAAKITSLKSELGENEDNIKSTLTKLQQEWDEHDRAVQSGDEGAKNTPPKNVMDAAFITFKSLKSATCARQLSHHELPFTLLAEEAPVPNHVVWHNCGMNHYKKTVQQVLAMACTGAICIFWVIPMTFVASFQKVEELKKFGPSGCEEAGNCPIKVASDYVPLLEEILAILAPLALIGLSYMLPVILWYVVALEGHIGMNTFHASLFFKLTLFMIVQTFFVSAVAGALFAELDSFIQSPLSKGQEILANSLPAQAVTFMSLIFVKSTYKMMMELLRPRSALYGWMRTFIGPRLTAEERGKDYFGLTPFIWNLRPFSSPGPLKYHVLFPDLVLMFTVLFVYSVLSPISNVVLLPAFMFINIGNRHQMIYVYDPSNDTGGQLWPQFARYFMVSMLIAQFTVFGVLGLSESAGAPLMIPLIIITVLFSRYIRQQHPRVSQAMPMFVCHEADMAYEEKGDGQAFLTDKYKQKALITAASLLNPPDVESGPKEEEPNGEEEQNAKTDETRRDLVLPPREDVQELNGNANGKRKSSSNSDSNSNGLRLASASSDVAVSPVQDSMPPSRPRSGSMVPRVLSVSAAIGVVGMELEPEPAHVSTRSPVVHLGGVQDCSWEQHPMNLSQEDALGQLPPAIQLRRTKEEEALVGYA